jgi:hypothetical protein
MDDVLSDGQEDMHLMDYVYLYTVLEMGCQEKFSSGGSCSDGCRDPIYAGRGGGKKGYAAPAAKAVSPHGWGSVAHFFVFGPPGASGRW